MIKASLPEIRGGIVVLQQRESPHLNLLAQLVANNQGYQLLSLWEFYSASGSITVHIILEELGVHQTSPTLAGQQLLPPSTQQRM